MRKVLIALATAGATLAVAAPAAAQYYPVPPAYGYGNPYGNGYNNGYAYSRGRAQQELQQIRFEADRLARSGRLDRKEARDLYRDIASAERSLYRADSWRDSRNLREKIQNLRYELRRYSDYDGRRYGYNNGWNNYDRDRDGRDDRYEDDHGYYRDR
jgi:hypothetical protein